MRSIQTNPMIFMSDRLSVAFSFSRRAHLLTTRRWRAVVSLLLVGIVRSPRGMRLLRQPYGQCHTSAELLSLSTQLALCSSQRLPHFFVQQCVPTACENLPPAAFHSVGYRPGDTHFLFAKKKQKQGRKDGENEWRFTT